MTLLLLAPAALAAEAWYDPDAVAASSELFVSFAQQMGPWYDDLQDRVTRASIGLEGLDTAVALAGAHADEELKAYAQQLRKQAAHQYLQVQRFADVLAEDSEQTFGAAMVRALEDLGIEAEPCQPRSAVMIGPNRGAGGGDCEGRDISAELATRMDADAELQAAVAEILALDWPGFEVAGTAQVVLPLTGTGRYVQLDQAADALMEDRLDALARSLEDQLAPLEDRLAVGAEGAEEALSEAEGYRSQYDRAVAAEGERLLAALERGLRKHPDVGVCANPAAFGGCEGDDATAELLPLLVEDKKVLKALK